MGILPGVEMEVYQSGSSTGNVRVNVRQSSLVLGESLAKSIYCHAVDDNDVHSR
jgi:Fe2+ transport system protein FeoA